jgi:hypothetical protein
MQRPWLPADSPCSLLRRNFIRCEEAVPILIASLQHQEYKVTVCCLSALCNLSASPGCILRYASDERLLLCLERILVQNVQDVDPQAHAAQLLLNLTRATQSLGTATPEECTVVSSATQTQNTPTAAFSRELPSVHAALTIKSTRDSDTQISSHKPLGVTTGSASSMHSDEMPRFPRPDYAALMTTGLRVLSRAPSLEQEARENCIEVVLSLLQRPDSSDLPEPHVRAASP